MVTEVWSSAEYAPLALLWLVILLRLPSWRKSGEQRVVVVTFMCFAMSETIAVLGVSGPLVLIRNLLSLLGVVVALELALVVPKPAFVRGAQVFFLSAMMCMIALVLVAPPSLVVSYGMIDNACLVIALCIALAILFPQWRSAEPGPLRKALLLLWSGAVLGLGYSGCRVWYEVEDGTRFVQRADLPLYGSVEGLLLFLSLLSAGVGGLVGTLYRWRGQLARYLTYYRLNRLWAQLTDAVPSVVLEQPPRVLLSSLELRLFRRTVEIRDAQVELVGCVLPEQREEARRALGGSDDELDACTLLMALRLKRNGSPSQENPVELTWAEDVSLDGELRSLLALDRAMRSPAVKEAAGRALRSADLPDAEERRAVGGNLRADRA